MLQITDQAATLLKDARAQVNSSVDAGVRLAPESTPEGVGIRIGFVDEPEGSDQVIEQAGMRVFVAAELSEPLEDKTLDAEATPQGAQLLIREQLEP